MAEFVITLRERRTHTAWKVEEVVNGKRVKRDGGRLTPLSSREITIRTEK